MSEPPPHSQRIPVIRRSAPPGSAPGTLVIDTNAPSPRLTAIGYSPDSFIEREIQTVADLESMRGSYPVLWVNVDGLGDQATLEGVAKHFSLHRLALEDVVNLPQRAKVEPYDEHLFIVTRMIRVGERVDTEQVSLFVGDGYLLTFQEQVGDSFDRVRERLRKAHGRIRRAGADYLGYALIDALIDAYYPVLEQYGDRIEMLEEEVLQGDGVDAIPRIHAMKRDLLMIRRALAPHREALHLLVRDESPLIRPDTLVYLRDVYDHIVQLLDMVETYRELSSGLLDVHLTAVSNRMNEVMQVLTIFAAIFIPLSFIAGLYGMNFSADSPWTMPELQWAFGYPAVLIVMATVAGGLLLFFRRRGWIGRPKGRKRP